MTLPVAASGGAAVAEHAGSGGGMDGGEGRYVVMLGLLRVDLPPRLPPLELLSTANWEER